MQAQTELNWYYPYSRRLAAPSVRIRRPSTGCRVRNRTLAEN
jgi:hypothetical protein